MRLQKGGVKGKLSLQRQGTVLIKEWVQGVTCRDRFCFHAQDVMVELQSEDQLDAEVRGIFSIEMNSCGAPIFLVNPTVDSP